MVAKPRPHRETQQLSPNTRAASSRSMFAVVGFLVLLEFGSGLLQGWLGPLLPAIAEAYGESAATVNWVNAIYFLATVLCVPILAKLGDLFGHKRLLIISIVFVVVGSILVAFAPNFVLLLLGRAIQAPLLAFLPLEIAIVHQRSAGASGRGIGQLIGALTVGGITGFIFSGLILNGTGNLTMTLLVPGIFMALCVPVAWFLVPETAVRKTGRVDWWGSFLFSTGMLLTLLGVSNGNSWGWASPGTISSIVAGLALILGWIFIERRVETPLVDLRTLKWSGIGLPILIAFLVGAQSLGAQAPISVFLQADPVEYGYGLGLSSSQAGLALALYALLGFVGAVTSNRMVRAVGSSWTIALTGVVVTVVYVLMTTFFANALVFIGLLALSGLCGGIVLSAVPSVVASRAEADSVGIASGLYNTSRSVAGSVAGAMFALVMSSLVTTRPDGSGGDITSLAGFQAVWVICAAASTAFAVLAFFLRPAESLAARTAS